MAKVLTKSQIIQAIADAHKEKLARKDVARVLESLASVGHKELKKNGIFVLHGFAKFVVVKKPARPAREGINPFTKEKQKFAAKPASKAVRARPVKAIKLLGENLVLFRDEDGRSRGGLVVIQETDVPQLVFRPELLHIAVEGFEAGRRYREAEVNEILQRRHDERGQALLRIV